MERYQKLQERLLVLEISQKDERYKYCQSCGRTFSSILTHGHFTNGETNPAFCIECYDNGKFKEPNLTVIDFRERIKNIVSSKKSKKEKEILQKRFDNLERWKNDPYS